MKTLFDRYLIANHNLCALKLILQTAPTADNAEVLALQTLPMIASYIEAYM